MKSLAPGLFDLMDDEDDSPEEVLETSKSENDREEAVRNLLGLQERMESRFQVLENRYNSQNDNNYDILPTSINFF